MIQQAKQTVATVVPTLRYRDAAAAIDWLCNAFGLQPRLIVPGENGMIVHSQLQFGNGLIMVSSARGSELDALTAPSGERVAAHTQGAYVIVNDPDAHHDHAVAAGAEVVMPLKTEDHGRGYSCADPEGYLWHFGDYDPWA
jgi:uncharacterized glyoxalase superfamily protein PhnB